MAPTLWACRAVYCPRRFDWLELLESLAAQKKAFMQKFKITGTKAVRKFRAHAADCVNTDARLVTGYRMFHHEAGSLRVGVKHTSSKLTDVKV